MFNLEQSISAWRRRMLAAGIKAPVPLEELESHLRETIDRQVRAGVDAEIAFDMAIGEIGRGKELKTEFFRAGPWRSILGYELVDKKWVLKWAPVLQVSFFALVSLFYCGLIFSKVGAFGEMTPGQRISCFAAVITGYLLFNSGLLAYRFFPIIRSNVARFAIGMGANFASCFFIMGFLARVNAGMATLAYEFTWAFFVPMGALGGLALGLERAALKNRKPAGS